MKEGYVVLLGEGVGDLQELLWGYLPKLLAVGGEYLLVDAQVARELVDAEDEVSTIR